jgi:hypothetical protein
MADIVSLRAGPLQDLLTDLLEAGIKVTPALGDPEYPRYACSRGGNFVELRFGLDNSVVEIWMPYWKAVFRHAELRKLTSDLHAAIDSYRDCDESV